MWHLNNRNKRGIALDLKSPDAGKILERLVKWADVLIVNTPHPAREETQTRLRRRRAVESAADLRRHHRLRRQGTGRGSSRIRHHGLLGAEWLAFADARCGRSADLAVRRHRR